MEPYHKQIQKQILLENSGPAKSVVKEPSLKDRDGKALLMEVLAAMRALSWLHQTAHWQASGQRAYELHLLFERLYDATEGDVDVIAEKLVGYYGAASVESLPTLQRTQNWLRSWNAKGENPITKALNAEKEFQGLLKITYEALKEGKELSLGLDDFLMATANKHETHIYLLTQAN